jgi:type IV fimbrial biogenesis protein FimT
MQAMRVTDMGKATMQRSQDPRERHRASKGFTLVELMVTIAVLAILLTLGVPSFTAVINNNRLAAGANEFAAALQHARMEAMRRNTRVIVCRSDDQVSCSAGSEWRAWVVFVDRDRDGVADAASGTTATEVIRVGALPAPVMAKVSTNVVSSRIFFRPDGRAYKSESNTTMTDELLKATVGVCISGARQPSQNQREIRLMSGSRVSMSRSGTGSGVCPALSNPTS